MAAYPVRYRKAVTYVAVDGSFAGFLALSDTLRQESAEIIAVLSVQQVRSNHGRQER